MLNQSKEHKIASNPDHIDKDQLVKKASSIKGKTLVAKTANRLKSQLGSKKIKKQSIKKVVILVAAVVAIVSLIALINNMTMPVKISKLETTKALSSRTQDAPVQNSFKTGEPIMLHLEFRGAKVGSGIKFEVVDEKSQIIKSGTTTVLRPTGDDLDSGERFVSIVNTSSTSIPAGKYVVKLSYEDRHLRTLKFEVTE
jgi:hypothetical protein